MIYKRTPVQHSLPNGWNNMDAVKYFNINNIKGLQHVNNVLAADQNSTHNCKNVYQDESGNLTVRPALRPVKKILNFDEVLGVYKTSKYELVHGKINDDYVIQDQFGISSFIGEGNITVQESDGKVYVMYTNEAGYLQFKEWNDGLVDFDPDIPLNSVDTPVSRLYNLLSKETKFITKTVLPREITDDLFNPPVSTVINKIGALDIDILQSGHIIFVYTDSIIVAIPYGNKFRLLEIPADIPQDADILIEDVLADSHCIVSFTAKDGDTLTRTQYTVMYSGETQIISWDITQSDVCTFKTAYDNSLGVIHIENFESTISGVTRTYYYIVLTWYIDGVKKVTHSFKSSIRGRSADSEDLAAKLAVSKASLVIVCRFFHGETEADHDYFYNGGVRIIPFDLEYLLENTGRIHEGELWNYDQYTSISVASGYSNWYIIHWGSATEWHPHIYYDWNYYEDATSALVKVEPIILELYSRTLIDIVPTFDGLLLSSNEEYYYINSKTQRSYVSEFFVPDASPIIRNIYNYDGTTIIANTGFDYTIFSRNIKPQYLVTERTVSDSFPVLSEIQDEVITSFYLDNIYWFVTKHRVFGTGVANEEFSIKYFDPRKYFHFDETITGAIRISDSSFWVFHNNGAYLIYKSSTEVYDELSGEYITMITWLCTSTAESKGCDFENAVITLPVTNYIACATSDDISSIQMRENVQTDDRILVPMTLGIQSFIASVLNETESIVTGTFRYNALFFLNPAKESNKVPVMVYNAITDSWWYWELPVCHVYQTRVTEDNIEILAKNSADAWMVYDLYTDYYEYKTGGFTWKLYADRVIDNKPVKIDWFWESSMLHFNTIDYKKQLLFTNFTFSEKESYTTEFEYNFKVYDKEYSEATWTDVTQVVEKAKTYSCKNVIAKYMYLQLYIQNTSDTGLESHVCPKFSAISFKYRILPGGLL